MQKISSILLFSILAFCFLNACRPTADDNPTTEEVSTRGNIQSKTLLKSYTVAQVDSIFAVNGFGSELHAHHAIELHKIVYETIDWDGKKTIASGLLVTPTDMTTGSLDINSYAHGTIAKKTDVPSRGETQEVLIGIAMAGDLGYLVPLPDYLGLGDSPGMHPYTQAKTEATAIIDMLRAARNFSKERNQALSGKVFLMGYSQGGHAAMAAQREIEANYSNEFTLTAVAPLSGPYNTSGVQASVIVQDADYPAPGYLPYILLGYNQVYHLFNSPSEIMIAPYDQTLPPLFDGTYGIGDVDNVMPTIPNKIIKPAILDSFRNDLNHRFRRALRDNDLIDWTPKTPMLMCACTGDKHVSSDNAMVAYYSFVNRGSTSVRPPKITQGFDHGSCVLPSLLDARDFFQTFR